MQLSARGLALIMRFEGFRDFTYVDAAGKLTIGFGHQLKPGERFDNGVSRTQAEELLAKDAEAACRAVRRLVRVKLAQSQFDALASLVYNIGAGAFSGSTLLKRLNAGCLAAAADEFLRWNKIRRADGYAESPGLTARRAAERMMFLER